MRHVVPSGQIEPDVHVVVQPSDVQSDPDVHWKPHWQVDRVGGFTRRQPRPSQK